VWLPAHLEHAHLADYAISPSSATGGDVGMAPKNIS
jgi:hypothetical protein